MSRTRYTQNSFVGGALDPSLFGRTDIPSYYAAAAKLENMVVLPQGGVKRREGLRYVNALPAASAVRLVSFTFNDEQSYLFVFSVGQLDIYRDDALVFTTTAAPIDALTEDMLGTMNWTQSNDVLLLVHPDFVVTVEREIHQCVGDDFRPLTEWNEQCAATQAELFATVADDLPELFAWVNDNFEAHLYADKWSPFCFIARDNADADAIQQRVEQHFAGVPQLTFVRNDIYARLSHAAFTKGSAMAEVARHLGIPREGIFAAGDHWNDLPMLQSDLAEWIVAPANAVPEVIEHVEKQGGFVAQAPTGLGVLEGLEWALADSP